MTPRERALACHDILATIFDQLAPVPSDGVETTEKSRWICRKALATSARTCTTFSHHALNVLWRELDSIHPLIKVLPNCRLVEWHLTLCGAISDEGWDRFQLYADRVRAIIGTLEPDSLDLIHPSIWLFLAQRCKGSPLMPRIRNLVVLDLLTSEASALVLQLSPSLRSLNVLFSFQAEKEDRPVAPNVARSLLETIPLIAPDLEQFYCDVDVDISRAFIGSFAHCARLKTLSISATLPLDENALRMLPSIPSLRDLTCFIDLSSNSGPLRPYTFQYLARLHVTGSFDDITTFIDACQFPSLTRITVRFRQPPSAQDPLRSLTAVCQRFNPALITYFSAIILYPFESANTPRPNCLMEYFEPLLAFPNIRDFCLWYSCAIPSINDDDLTRIGTAWPQLTSFSVSRLPMKLDVPPELMRPTLSALIDLARRCPHLESFSVPELDAQVIPQESSVALPLGHGLRSLSVNDVVLPSPEPSAHLAEVAGVVDRVFPSIELEERKTSANGWVRLLRSLKQLRASREP